MTQPLSFSERFSANFDHAVNVIDGEGTRIHERFVLEPAAYVISEIGGAVGSATRGSLMIAAGAGIGATVVTLTAVMMGHPVESVSYTAKLAALGTGIGMVFNIARDNMFPFRTPREPGAEFGRELTRRILANGYAATATLAGHLRRQRPSAG